MIKNPEGFSLRGFVVSIVCRVPGSAKDTRAGDYFLEFLQENDNIKNCWQ